MGNEHIMTEHILLQRATRRPFHQIPDLPSDARYDCELGCWLVGGLPLVSSKEYGEPVSKKCDQETGEDQKGE